MGMGLNLFKMAASIPPSGKLTIKKGVPSAEVSTSDQVKDGARSELEVAKPIEK
jgi:hypothetical protein